jgi:hypothetical protein
LGVVFGHEGVRGAADGGAAAGEGGHDEAVGKRESAGFERLEEWVWHVGRETGAVS